MPYSFLLKHRKHLIWAGFCLYGLFALLFFVYLTLPVAAIGFYLLAKMSEQTGIQITANGFKRSAPFGFDAEDIRVTDLSGTRVFMTGTRLTLTVDPSSLLSHTKRVSVSLPIYGGSAESHLSVDSSGPRLRYDLDATFDGIRLQEFPVLQSALAALPNLQAERDHGVIRGVGRVEIHYAWDAGQPTMGSGQISIAVQDLKAEKMAVLNLPASDLSFPKVIAKLTLKDGIATLNELTGNGSEMDISGNGLAQLRQPLTSSLLNLTMKLALKNKTGLPDALVLLKSLVGENRPIEVSITGTIGRPFINTRGLPTSPISHVSLGPLPLASPTSAASGGP